MKNSCYKKTLVLGIIVLFIGMSITPSTGNILFFDDTTPPVTTISFDPPEPNGLEGWYVSDVTVTLNATDDLSGVNATYYRIAGGEWETYDSPFVISEDGDDILIEFYSIDNAGNEEPINLFIIDIDQTEPEIYLDYYLIGGNPVDGWDLLFEAYATDDMSGMNRVEFYFNDELQDTVYGPGPTYCCWYFTYRASDYITHWFKGLIRNVEITEDYVKFYAIIVKYKWRQNRCCILARAYDKAGNWDYDSYTWGGYSSTPAPFFRGYYLFQNFTFPNDYEGYIGKFYIDAIFNEG